MKYLKKFEVSCYDPIGVCWKIILNGIDDIYISAKLDKIGMPKDRQERFINHYEDLLDNTTYINITNAIISMDFILGVKDDKFSWSFSGNIISYERLGYEYKGEILLTEDEKEECRVREEAKKYNL